MCGSVTSLLGARMHRGDLRQEDMKLARKALEMSPEDMIQVLKDSGLRGRGGAGFPTGLKFSFVAQGTGKPVYLVVNADESEPGTFKDRPLMERDPHSLIEGIIASCLAIQSEMAFVYLRGEFGWVSRRMRRAVEQAYEKGYLGEDIFGSGKRVDIVQRGYCKHENVATCVLNALLLEGIQFATDWFFVAERAVTFAELLRWFGEKLQYIGQLEALWPPRRRTLPALSRCRTPTQRTT